MNRMLFKISLLVLIFLPISLTYALSPMPESIKWHSYSASAFSDAKREHKLILLFAKVEWCPWCQKMENYTFQDPEVAQIVNARYIPIRIDLENDGNVASRYEIKSIPTVLILDSQNRVLKTISGYTYPHGLAKTLRATTEP